MVDKSNKHMAHFILLIVGYIQLFPSSGVNIDFSYGNALMCVNTERSGEKNTKPPCSDMNVSL